MDTRLSWTFGDDDFLHPTGELIPLSPTWSVGDRPQYRLFFDALNSRYAGRENLTHLVMYKKMPGFIPHLTTEAAIVLRFDLDQLAANTGNLNQALYDTGSYLRLFYNTGQRRTRRHLGDLLPARHRPLPPRLPLRHLVGRHGVVHQPVDLPEHPGKLAGPQGPVRPEEVLRVRRLQDGADRSAAARSEPRQPERHRDRRRRRHELRLPRRRRIRPAREPPVRRRRRLLPAGPLQPARRARTARVHVRRLGARTRAQGHAGPAVDRLLALPQRPDGADDPLRAREVQLRPAGVEHERARATCSSSTSRTSTPSAARRTRPRGRRAAGGRQVRVHRASALTGIARDLNYVIAQRPRLHPLRDAAQQRAEPAGDLRLARGDYTPPTRTSRLASRGGVQLPGDVPERVHRRRRRRVANHRRPAAGRRVDPPVRPGPPPIFQARISLRWDLSRHDRRRRGSSTSATRTARSSWSTRPRAPRLARVRSPPTASARP